MTKKTSTKPASTEPVKPRSDAIIKAQPKNLKAKDDDDDDDDSDDGEGDEDEDSEGLRKGKIAMGDLEKGLAELESVGSRERSRKAELLDKARKETRLTAEERKELDAELGGGESLVKALEKEEDLVKAMDVSPALDLLASKVAEAVDGLSSKFSKSIDDRGEFDRALAKSLVAMGKVLEAQQTQIVELKKSLEDVLDSPAREPKSDKIVKALERPLGGSDPNKQVTTDKPNDQTLDPRKLVGVLETMHRDSIQKGRAGMSPSGLSIKDELTKALTWTGVGGARVPVDQRILKDVAEFQKARA